MHLTIKTTLTKNCNLRSCYRKEIMIQDEPEQFRELCEKVGLALIIGQKLQFTLAYYYSVFHMVNSKWSKEESKEKIDFHLSKPMGIVVNSLEKEALLEGKLLTKIKEFKTRRNWLAHDFDEESMPFISQGLKFDHYITIMDNIVSDAHEIMKILGDIGEELIPVRNKKKCI